MNSRPISPRFGRLVPVLAAAVLFAAIATIYLAASPALYHRVIAHYGVEFYPLPFIDIAGSLSAWDCARIGLDVINFDPCDMLGRSYSYSPIWMSFSFIPLGLNQRVTVALILDALFILSLALLPPARTRRGLVLVTLATVSTMTVFAVERCNPDIIIFMMALASGYLLLGGGAARFAAYLLALFAAMIKYYPAVMLLVVVRERFVRFIAACAVIFALSAVFLVHYGPEIREGLAYIPRGAAKGDMFAARNLPVYIAERTYLYHPVMPLTTLFALYYDVMLIGCGVSAIATMRRVDFRAAFETMGRLPAILMVIGGVTITGCFFAGQNIGYRGIFLLLALPGFIAMAERGGDGATRRQGSVDAVLVVALMWGEFFRVNIDATLNWLRPPWEFGEAVVWGFWAVREIAWWYLAGEFIAALAVFLWHSATFEAVLRALGRFLPASAGDRQRDA